MSEDPDTNSADRDAEIEREIRTNRKFSLSGAIGRMTGGDFEERIGLFDPTV